MRSKVLLAATAILLSLGTVGAKADTYQFTVVDGVNTATFDLSENPTPYLDTPTLFQVNNVQINVVSNGYDRSDTEALTFTLSAETRNLFPTPWVGSPRPSA